MRAYLELTKPTIMLLVTFTGAAALIVEGSLLSSPIRLFLVLIGLFLTGGAANGLNQYFEREIDAKMSRTAGRRPLPTGRVKPSHALAFSILIGVAGVVLFATWFNLLTAALALGNILFYGLFYTLYLKPSTPQNIVIGGIAGAMAPVGAWTAATGRMEALPWLMFLLIFLWTPPHFWTLAMRLKDDYKKAELPMYPLVKGDQAALDSIFRYTLVLFGLSLSLVFFGMQWLYMTVALLLGSVYLVKTWIAKRGAGPNRLAGLFRFSLIYLFGLFTAIIVDRFV
ncbi:MAG: heme o synthase [candidate division Zixibacteria bacterium]|nr:heme o synthase [candidate division Zixibacteria bacterium]MDH3935982.1 heme o synthase [candidate division Zixibacteria bacterium]MDH4032701.1 heme o synthase [candidate division Zixibacteria bacterium]